MYKPILNDLFKMENLPVSGTMETVPLDVWMIMYPEMQNSHFCLCAVFIAALSPFWASSCADLSAWALGGGEGVCSVKDFKEENSGNFYGNNLRILMEIIL